MKYVPSAAIVLSLLGVLLLSAGCTGNPPPPTPDPRIDQLQTLAQYLSHDIAQLTEQVVQLQSTPPPTPTPGPTLEEIEVLVGNAIATAVEELPTPTPSPTKEDVQEAVQEGIQAYDATRPIPTLSQIESLLNDRISDAVAALPPPPTPGPTPADIQGMIDESIAEAIASLPPAPTPGPTLDEIHGLVSSEVETAVSQLPSISVVPQSSASSRTSLTEDINITVHPGRPIAGRDVRFTLDGLDPWTRIEVEFIDPRNQPAEWVTNDEGHFTRENGDPVTTHRLFADESGSVSWQRIAAKDAEGIWTVRIDIDGVRHSATYPVSQLQLSVQDVETVGLEMRRYQGTASDSYIASLVHTSFAVDLQAHLVWLVRRLDEEYGLRSTQIPDIYLVGDRTNLESVAQSIGTDVGFEYGFYRSFGSRPGIYMRTDEFRTGVQRVLTHEYVHLIVGELSNNRNVPAWLNEGLAEYFESKLGLESERPNATRLLTYRQFDDVKNAQAAGLGLSLTELESQSTWNSQTDSSIISQQYGKAHMAVLYITQEFAADAPIHLIRRIGRGMSLSSAIEEVLGITYEELQEQVDIWIAAWTDPEREDIRTYVTAMNAIYAAVDEQMTRRNDTLGDQLPLSQRAAVLRDVVSNIVDIQNDLNARTPPESAQTLHMAFTAYVNTIVDWLTLERDYANTGRDSIRTQANDMLPEVNARGALVWRSLNNLQYVYQVGRY